MSGKNYRSLISDITLTLTVCLITSFPCRADMTEPVQTGVEYKEESVCTAGSPVGELICNSQIDATTEGQLLLFNGYSCTSWNESGPETIYKFTPIVSQDVSITLSNLSVDLDVFVLQESCDSQQCVTYGDSRLVFWAEAGKEYYVVVDGYNGAAGSFTLTVTCIEPLTYGSQVEATTVGRHSTINSYSCDFWNESGPEAIYKFTPAANRRIFIALSNLSVDLDVFVLQDSCDPQQCIMCGNSDIEFWAEAGRDYYVIVDGYNGAAGSFTLTVMRLHTLICGSQGLFMTEGQSSCINNYSCSSRDESGPETFFMFTPMSDANISLLLSNMSADLDLFVLEGSFMAKNCVAWGDSEASLTVLANTDYFVIVDGFDGTAGIFDLTMTCSTAEGETEGEGWLPDVYEPDDTCKQASRVTSDQYQRHTLHVSNDEDWVKFSAHAGQIWDVQAFNLGPDCNPYLELYKGGESTPLMSGNSSITVFAVPVEGMYYIRVRYAPGTPFPSNQPFDTSYILMAHLREGGLSATLVCSVMTLESQPIVDATVSLEPFGITVTENINGVYMFPAICAPSTFTVWVEAPHYDSANMIVSVQNGETKSIAITLEPAGGDGEGQEEGEIQVLAILQQLRSASLYVGMSWSATIQVGGGVDTIAYDWKKDGVSLGWPSSMVHVLGPLVEADAGVYNCTVSDGITTLDSTNAELSICPRSLTGQHDVDQNQDWIINLSELLRVIQFFNSGAFHCAEGTEDGYAPDSGDQTCNSYGADYNPQDWTIELTELLRLIQFFNSACYHVEVGTEDGYAPEAG